MANKKLLLGLAAGAAAVSTVYYLSKKGKINWNSMAGEAESLISGMKNRISDTSQNDISENPHDGKHLAKKIRHNVEHKLAGERKG